MKKKPSLKMDENIPGSFSSRHGLALIEFISVIALIGFGIWFIEEWIKWEGKSFNPTSEENTLNIKYNMQAISSIFLTIVSICVVVYAVCGSVTASHSENINLYSTTLSAAIIPGVLGGVLFLNGGMSYDAQKKVNNTYDNADKQAARNALSSRNIPYDNLGAASFAVGSVQIAMMIVILCYYYLVVAKDKPAPPVYIPPPKPAPPPVPDNYLENDRIVRKGSSIKRVQFAD